MGLIDSLKAHPTPGAHNCFSQIPGGLPAVPPVPGVGVGWGGRLPGCGHQAPGVGVGAVAHHKELAERDVGEDVVCLVLPTHLLRLLPKVGELLC